MSTDEWLTPREFGDRTGCSDQTVIARIKGGEFDAADVQIHPEGSRPRYLVHARALGAVDVAQRDREPGSSATEVPASRLDATEIALLRDELERTRRDLTDTAAERDRLRAEVAKLRDVGLHLTRATEAFLLPDTLND
jgi:hypothetical protein